MFTWGCSPSFWLNSWIIHGLVLHIYSDFSSWLKYLQFLKKIKLSCGLALVYCVQDSLIFVFFLCVKDVQADKVYYTVHTNQCIDVNYRLVTDYIHPIHPPIYTIQKLICHVNAGCQFHILRQVTEFLLIEIALWEVINSLADDKLEECWAELHIENQAVTNYSLGTMKYEEVIASRHFDGRHLRFVTRLRARISHQPWRLLLR